MRISIAVTFVVFAAIFAASLGPAAADYTPSPGQLHVANDLATQSGGGCEGTVTAHYGFKTIQRPAGTVLEILANCTAIVRWAQSGPTATPLSTAVVAESTIDESYGVDGEYKLMTAWTHTGPCWTGYNEGGVYLTTGDLNPVYLTVQEQGPTCEPIQYQIWSEDGTLDANQLVVDLWHESSASGVKCEWALWNWNAPGIQNGEMDCFFWVNNDIDEPDPARVATTLGEILEYVVAGDDELISGL